jgi:hypothetical protein
MLRRIFRTLPSTASLWCVGHLRHRKDHLCWCESVQSEGANWRALSSKILISEVGNFYCRGDIPRLHEPSPGHAPSWPPSPPSGRGQLRDRASSKGARSFCVGDLDSAHAMLGAPRYRLIGCCPASFGLIDRLCGPPTADRFQPTPAYPSSLPALSYQRLGVRRPRLCLLAICSCPSASLDHPTQEFAPSPAPPELVKEAERS